VSESKTQTIKMIPDNVHAARLALFLAARGVNGDGFQSLVDEVERIGRLADAMAAIVQAVADSAETENPTPAGRDARQALLWAAGKTRYTMGVGVGLRRAAEIMEGATREA